jgi:hypothetical protein
MNKLTLKNILNEIINPLLESKSVGDIYHFTSFDNLIKILEQNRIAGSEDENTPPTEDTDPILYISFTRDKNFLKTHKRTVGTLFPYVKIKFNGSKLSNNYKIEPHQYEGTIGKKDANVGDEQEERLIIKKNKSSIDNIKKYIINITLYDIIFDDKKVQYHLLKFLNKYVDTDYNYKDDIENYSDFDYDKKIDFIRNIIKLIETKFKVDIDVEKF